MCCGGYLPSQYIYIYIFKEITMIDKYKIEDFDKLSIYDGLQVLRIINTLLLSQYQNQGNLNPDKVIIDVEEFLKLHIDNVDDKTLYIDAIYLSCLLQPDDFKFIAGLFYEEIRGQKIKLTKIKDIKFNAILKEFIREGYGLLNSDLFQ